MRQAMAAWQRQTAGSGDVALIDKAEQPEGKAGSAWSHSADGRRPSRGGKRG